jgi:hypothetical protein
VDSGESRADSAQNAAESESKMRFPVKVRFRKAEKWFAVAPERPANVIPLAAAPAAQESPR